MKAVLVISILLGFCCQQSLQESADETGDQTKDRDGPLNFDGPSMNFFNSQKTKEDTQMVEELKMKVDSMEGASSANSEMINSNCIAMKNLLSVMQPEITADTNPTAPQPNPVSGAIGRASSTEDGGDWTILFPITAGGVTMTDGYVPNGLNTAGQSPSALGTDMNTAALSITDFNFFRIQMINALRVLDQSIRDILSVQAPMCSGGEATTTGMPVTTGSGPPGTTTN